MNQVRQISTVGKNKTPFTEKEIEVYPALSLSLIFSDIEELDKLEQKDKCDSEGSQFFYIAILLPARFEKISAKENLIIQYP